MTAAKPRRRGGKPTYSPETAAARKAGKITLGLSPERAAALRSLGEHHAGGMTGVVSDWIDASAQQAAVLGEIDEAADRRAAR